MICCIPFANANESRTITATNPETIPVTTEIEGAQNMTLFRTIIPTPTAVISFEPTTVEPIEIPVNSPTTTSAPVAIIPILSVSDSGTIASTLLFPDASSKTPIDGMKVFGDESYNHAWVQQTSNAGWTPRIYHSSVVLDDTIILMGGYDKDSTLNNDIWTSTDGGITWSRIVLHAGWSARYGHSCVAMPDGSIILVGGIDSTLYRRDIWRSTDSGLTWTQMTADGGWFARPAHASAATSSGRILMIGGGYTPAEVWGSDDDGKTWTQLYFGDAWQEHKSHSAVTMPDGSVIIMGGGDGHNNVLKNDVWRSTDGGTTWVQMTANAEWTARFGHTSVALSDGSIVLMGGYDGSLKNDTWRSTDNGTTWTRLPINAGWTARAFHSSVVMSDGSIVLIGGTDSNGERNDVWRLSLAQTPMPPTFSITEIGNPGWGLFENVSDNVDYCAHIVYWDLLEFEKPDKKWQLVFWKNETEVTKEDFGINGGGLNDAIFHYHAGHGSKDYIYFGNTYLSLSNGQSLHANDLEGKWGKNNKWVFLHACDVLDDPSWAKALDSTHGIFGFKSATYGNVRMVNSFFVFAKNEKSPVPLSEAFYEATYNNLPKTVTAAVIFGTKDQYDNDFLPGYGTTAPDRDPNEQSHFETEWQCGQGEVAS
jgi:photosystem II stability/assembly factor-like uncharacterized protein